MMTLPTLDKWTDDSDTEIVPATQSLEWSDDSAPRCMSVGSFLHPKRKRTITSSDRRAKDTRVAKRRAKKGYR
jgi:hypothetical protein